jgi:hypothetical protein
VTVVCVDGREYRADGRGVFDVPDAAAPRLMADFGLRPCAPQGPSEPRPAAPSDADYALMSTQDLVKEARRLGVPPDGLTRRKLIAALADAGAAAQGPGGF